VIDHPHVGRRTVCADHIDGHEIELYVDQTGINEFVDSDRDGGGDASG